MPANCRSRSTSATRRPAAASETARFALVSILPIPPFGPSTQISGDSALAPEPAAPLRRRTAFSTAKRSCSAALPISGPIVAGQDDEVVRARLEGVLDEAVRATGRPG